jgi:hypothetical protein
MPLILISSPDKRRPSIGILRAELATYQIDRASSPRSRSSIYCRRWCFPSWCGAC